VRAVSFIVLRAAQIGRKVPPFTRARRERKVPASPGRGRGTLLRRAHTSAAEGSGSQCSASKRRGGAVARPMLGRPKANSTRGPRKERQGVASWTRPGERQHPVGPMGREREKSVGWVSGPKAKEGRRE
jgi:hypothetical protein